MKIQVWIEVETEEGKEDLLELECGIRGLLNNYSWVCESPEISVDEMVSCE